MAIEGVLLTGGRSERMGVNKGSLVIDRVPMAERIAGELGKVCTKVTVLGRGPIPGCGLLVDREAYSGPLAALSMFHPSEELVFVASCDLPLFAGTVVQVLDKAIGAADAAIPAIEGRSQPLCALYRSEAFEAFRKAYAGGERSIQRAFSGLNVCFVSEGDLDASGVAPETVRGANTPEELEDLLRTNPPQTA